MNKFLNNNSGLVVVGTLIIAVCTVVVFYLKPNKDEDNNRIRIEQKVRSNELLPSENISYSDMIVYCNLSIEEIKPYVLETKGYLGTKLMYNEDDYGTFKEIESLKCIRYKQAEQGVNELYYLNNKKCN